MNILGIDLGTTFCAVSKINDIGKAEIVPFSNGERLLPSCVLFAGDKIYIGKEAQNNYGLSPNNYFEIIKRYMDREFYPELDENRKPIEGSARKVNGTPMKTVYLQSLILKHIKDDFESRYGAIDKVIVTVPAYFDEVRRNATLEASRLAGLPIEGLFNEPTSAGLYYANNYPQVNEKNLIFDLGGGTFDATIINIDRNGNNTNVDVISTLGDHELGGKDFDLKIFEELCKNYQESKNDELVIDDTHAFELLTKNSEEIKKILSNNDNHRIRISGNAGNHAFEINRSRFEELIGIYSQKVEMLVESLLMDSNLTPKDINDVILVGGSSRIPLFRNYLKNLFNKEPLVIGNVDEAVALGAALECLRRANESGTLTGVSNKVKNAANDLLVSDVCTYSYGTFALVSDEITGQRRKENVFIIKRNTKIPVKETKTFFLTRDDQTAVDISITQGESKEIDEVNVIYNGELDLSGTPTSEGDEVVVEYSYDINQSMHCVFLHKKSKKQYVVKLDKLS